MKTDSPMGSPFFMPVSLLSFFLFHILLFLNADKTSYFIKSLSMGRRIPLALPSDREVDSLFSDDEGIARETEIVNRAGFSLAQPAYSKYRIKNGEDILDVAESMNISVDAVITHNVITNGTLPKSGATLVVPSSDGLLHVVNSGESLIGIAAAYNTRLSVVLDANDLGDEVIHPGQRLFIPGGRLPLKMLGEVLDGFFGLPLQGRLISNFGEMIDPFTGETIMHEGIDIAALSGVPVKAAMTGKVFSSGHHTIYGKYVILIHSGGFKSLYAHLSSIDVAKGIRVNQGDIIANTGTTGQTATPHLHFSIFYEDHPVDPLLFF